MIRLKIPRNLVDELISHAREDLPNECCGMLGGGDGRAGTLYRAENAEASPFRYSISPRQQFDLLEEIDRRGEDLVAIYHSHTKSDAYPSQTDVNLAGWPDAVYLIVSLADRDRPDLRGFRIRDSEISEVELEIE